MAFMINMSLMVFVVYLIRASMTTCHSWGAIGLTGRELKTLSSLLSESMTDSLNFSTAFSKTLGSDSKP